MSDGSFENWLYATSTPAVSVGRSGKIPCQLAPPIITSQIPVKAWHDVIREPRLADAILDRIVHLAHVIKLTGETMRKQKKFDPT